MRLRRIKGVLPIAPHMPSTAAVVAVAVVEAELLAAVDIAAIR